MHAWKKTQEAKASPKPSGFLYAAVAIWLCCLWSGALELSGTWRFCNGPEFPGASGALELRDDALVLRHDFSGGGNYVAAYCDFDTPHYLKMLRFRLQKPREATITVRAVDAAGQCFQKSLHFDSAQIHDIAVNMLGWDAYWGGPNDGILRQPIHSFGILVESRGLSSEQGTVTFTPPRAALLSEDDMLEYTAVPDVAHRSYLVTDFGEGCVLARSAGTLRDGVWHIDFNASARSAMSGSLSLFHRPVTLTLRAQASAPGAALVFHIGAHFQHFKRTVGVFDGTEQVFTFNLPPEGWDASGAAHETLHYPLRITGVAVERHDCKSDTIDITLRDITCETAVDPRDAVVLMSRLHAAPPENDMRAFTLLCSGWNLLEKALDGIVTVHINNWDGATLHRTEIPVALPGGGRRRTVEYQFSLPASWRYVEARCILACNGQRPAEALSTFTATLTEDAFEELLPAPVHALQPESPWGMGVYLYRYPHTEAGLAEMDRAAALAAQAGVQWTREEFNYGMIEKAPGVYDFSFFDALVDTAYRHGISVYALLSYWSPFIEDPYTEEGIAAYCDYARATVRRYKDHIKHWEIYNEPNIFFWEGPKELYPVLLERAYATIKEEDPDARVLGISTAGIDRGFIRMVLEAGAPFDDLTIHPYRSRFIERNFIRELEHVANLVQQRPVWITEMGWSTQIGTGGKTEREQAQLLARAYLTGVGAGIRNMGWYNFRNDGDDPFYNEANFGVLHRNLTPKAAYRALAAVCRSLPVVDDMQPAWREGGDGTQDVYALGVGRNTALWAPNTDMTLVMEANAPPPLMLNLMGEPIEVEVIATLPAATLRPRGCRTTSEPDTEKNTIARFNVHLRQGDPVFALDSDLRMLSATPVDLENDAGSEILF